MGVKLLYTRTLKENVSVISLNKSTCFFLTYGTEIMALCLETEHNYIASEVRSTFITTRISSSYVALYVLLQSTLHYLWRLVLFFNV